MKVYSFFKAISPILEPKFYTINDSLGNELIFLDNGTRIEGVIDGNLADKTQHEALENHIHLFDKQKKRNVNMIREIGTKLALHLLEALESAFPTKKFIVYFEINITDSSILRFHQIWDDEPLYFDSESLKKLGIEVLEFKHM